MTTQEILTLRIGSQTKANGQPKETGTFRAMTFKEVLELNSHLVLVNRSDKHPCFAACYQGGLDHAHQTASAMCVWFLSTHKDARQAKVNGKVHTWKRDLTHIEVPLKYGLYEYPTMDKHDIEAGRLLVRIS